ncbi:alpha/beta fold hydrolase [Actinokineospora globicatena]|uniref:AB hydrolase-1 domain-containing protein n=1 Tax=Actinokineospora globicatena TaxID=103729 RepID=A0A9W6QR41_9PSEU|nr:alpha/beta fold hydrolase [Actinokineospora globicatena]GLW93235.1 hypothetical protein Aglo03_40510 [Actinokineospora globicatena]
MIGTFGTEKARERFLAAYADIQREWPVPAEEVDVETRYGTTRVRRSGVGRGTPLVLLPGFMGTSLTWYPHVAELSERHEVYAVDTLGEPGLSVQTRGLATDEDLAAWLSDLLAGLGHDKVHLVGISRGGFLALNLVIRSSDRVASVIAVEPGGFRWIGTRFILWSLIEIVRWLLPPALLRLTTTGDPTIRRTLRPLLFGGLKFKAHLAPQHLYTDDELRAIKVPTHLILAEHSVIHRAREVATRVAPLNPRIHTEVVPGANHVLNLQNPGLITTRILELSTPD